jgi:flagellar hook-basal body complex protein FliE
MSIEAAAAVAASSYLAPTPETTLASPQTSFSTVLAQQVEALNGVLANADRMIAEAAIDGSQPPHQVMLAMEEARLSFHLALQVRNKVLEAYQELMRMQV